MELLSKKKQMKHNVQANTAKSNPGRIQTIPIAKHPGFTISLSRALKKMMVSLVNRARTVLERQRARATVRGMMDLEDYVLEDMNLSRADLIYVLRSSKHLNPTKHLRLLSVQRRVSSRNDLVRRAAYYDSLMPASISKTKTNKATV